MADELKLQDFEKMANNRKLVIMKLKVDMPPHRAGEYAGFFPKIALAIYNNGYGVPKDLQTEEKPVVEPVRVDRVIKADRTVPQPPEPKPVKVDTSDIEIPEDWRDGHHFRRLALARKLRPGEDIRDQEVANAIIEEELKRRG